MEKPNPKDMFQKLLDIMAFLPVALETYDLLETNTSLDSSERRQERQSLLAGCATICEKLRDWYIQLCADVNGRSLWHTFPSDDPSYPFPQQFSFDDHTVAYTIMLYWTCSLVIQGTGCQLQRLLNEENPDLREPEILPDYVSPRFYAVNIAQVLPYFLHPDMGALGPNLALFPVGMAFAFFASPLRPYFAADWNAMKSMGSMVTALMEGKGLHINSSTKDVVLWFIKLFADLSARSLPRGAFLSGLLRAVGSTTAQRDSQSVTEV
jgi:hypothetical protein